jgi:hypothetical protein
MFSFLRVILAAIGGGLAVCLLWLLLNGMPGNPQRGWLERQPWPISSLPVCVAIGAALCFLQAATWRHYRVHAENLANTAASLRLDFRQDVKRSDLGGAAELRLFTDWGLGCDRFFGRFEGLELQMLDFSSARRASAQRRVASGHDDSHTVVVFPLPAHDWPVFEIHPRGLSTWVWDLLGCRGATFRFRDDHAVIDLDRSALARFNRRYRVFVSLAERIAAMAGLAVGLPVGIEPAQEGELSDRFTMSTLRRFSESRGWTVECCGTHVAFWRPGRIVPASHREAFLHEAADLYRSLAAPAKDAADANLVIEATEFDSSTLGRRMSGTVAGAFAGLVVAFAVCVPLLIALPHELSAIAVFAWPIVGFALMALGAYWGSRLAAARNGR